MLTRYQTNKNIQSMYNGTPFFGTRLYPVVSPMDSDSIYITGDTDYLDYMAFKFYNDASLWWIIAMANNLGTGRLSVKSGIQLRIPVGIEQIISKFNKLNS